jgi:hypothetical protein
MSWQMVVRACRASRRPDPRRAVFGTSFWPSPRARVEARLRTDSDRLEHRRSRPSEAARRSRPSDCMTCSDLRRSRGSMTVRECRAPWPATRAASSPARRISPLTAGPAKAIRRDCGIAGQRLLGGERKRISARNICRLAAIGAELRQAVTLVPTKCRAATRQRGVPTRLTSPQLVSCADFHQKRLSSPTLAR